MRETGKVFHFAGGGELATGQRTFEHERIEAGAGCIDGGGETCATGRFRL
jgi:hypothetical protein